jgi:stearoyl-CoA desaturase (delta-9 desaturase)
MRFWLWLTTGMNTKEWVAVHRKHHRYSDKKGDPHSPVVFGILKVLFFGAFLYNKTCKDKQIVNTYGVGTPNDFIEQHIYSKFSYLGVVILFFIDVILFQKIGILIWLVQMIWIPFWAAGVINGIGHFVGYRNGTTKDNSKNISCMGILIGGEELHNNHHLDPINPKLSRKAYEFDIGYMYAKILYYLGLAKFRS